MKPSPIKPFRPKWRGTMTERERVRESGLGAVPVARGEQALAQQDTGHHPIRLGSRGETQVLDGFSRGALGQERLSEREAEQRIRGIGRNVPTKDFGAGHTQPFDFADD